MNIIVKIETIKSAVNIELSSVEVKNQYNLLLDIVRDMEIDSRHDGTRAKIEVLDATLDLLGNMLLASEEDH